MNVDSVADPLVAEVGYSSPADALPGWAVAVSDGPMSVEICVIGE